VSTQDWLGEDLGEITAFRPRETPEGLLVAFSSRGRAPEGEPEPTAYLARRFTAALGRGELPLVRLRQVHGATAVLVSDRPGAGRVLDAGEADVLATPLSGVGLVVQTADCAPILLAGREAVAAAHAGWRGTAAGAATAAVRAVRSLGEDPAGLSAWIGPTIGPCCYEVGGEVAAQFAGAFVRQGCGGRFVLDVAAANRAQLEEAGVPAGAIAVHPACTKCGGDRFASWRRDGVKAGRMIGLIAKIGTRDSELGTRTG
jgi:YfiH family protein